MLRRALLTGVGVGVVVALTTAAVVFSFIAIPLFLLAQVTGDSAVDDPILRDGLLRWSIPAGLVAGTVIGAVVGRWYARGGRLPRR